MKLDAISFVGPPIDDIEVMQWLPANLQGLLKQINGFIQFGGGLHIRGACRQPTWHSIGWSWQGDKAFHRRYSAVSANDVPFAQDCLGDQKIATVNPLGFRTSAIFDLAGKIKTIINQVTVVLKKIGEGLSAAATGSPEAVKNAVAGGLDGLTKFLLTFLGAFGLDAVKATIKNWLAQLQMQLKCKLQKFLAWLIGKCGKCAQQQCQQGGMPPAGNPANPLGQCFSARIRSLNGNGDDTERMIKRKPGQKAAGFRPGEPGYGQGGRLSEIEANPWAHREVWFIVEYGEGQWVKYGTIQSVVWLAVMGVQKVGDRVTLGLEEMGVVGEAQVMALEPCPPIEPGPGCIVMSVFEHSHGRIWEVWVDGDSEPIETTENHPFWSMDRQGWIPASELRNGECLSGLNGLVRIAKVRDTGRIEPVYNFEVEGDHCYRVGQQGILVHNASAPKYGPTMSLPFTGSDNMMHTATVGTWAETTLDSSNVGGTRVNLTEPAWWKFLTTAVAGAPVQQGHILASTLGGTEKGPTNFTPLYMKPNTPAMSTCERFLRDLIKKCNYCSVTLKVTVNGYGANPHAPAAVKELMPTSITMSWTIVDNGMSGTFTIENDPTATTQDPCKAKNLPCRQ